MIIDKIRKMVRENPLTAAIMAIFFPITWMLEVFVK
jgi:hypothetical protein